MSAYYNEIDKFNAIVAPQAEAFIRAYMEIEL